jgi:hypothetical protein
MTPAQRAYEDSQTRLSLGLTAFAAYILILFAVVRAVLVSNYHSGVHFVPGLISILTATIVYTTLFYYIRYLFELGQCRSVADQEALRGGLGLRPARLCEAAAILVAAELLAPQPLIHSFVLALVAIGLNFATIPTLKLWIVRFRRYDLTKPRQTLPS